MLPDAVVVDVSNVCWSEKLPARIGHDDRFPDLGRVIFLAGEWRARHGSGTEMMFVADTSLRDRLPEADQRRWPALVEEWNIVEAAVADEVFLPMARDNAGMVVLSRDQFLDHRCEHRWIEEHPERFLAWRMNGDTVEFVPSGIESALRQVVSRAKEDKLAHAAGLTKEILRTKWSCTNAWCTTGTTRRGELLLWPVADAEGRARCPFCEDLLAAIGPRERTKQLVLCDMTDAELLRFPLEAGVDVVIGRGRAIHGIGVDALPSPPERHGRVSRQHLLVRLRPNGSVTASDLGSLNGTRIHRAGAPANGGVRLEPHTAVTVGGHDLLTLGGSVRVYVSGQRYPAGDDRTWPGRSEPPRTEIESEGTD
ncbi:MAG: FHA domain-containing protein [Actinomycetota bacterium]|nr:FHA domain-containing protein [Actinomycetota bacterium]